jgi:hypothetical protein
MTRKATWALLEREGTGKIKKMCEMEERENKRRKEEKEREQARAREQMKG